MSALVPLMTSTGPLLDRASAGVRALMNAVSRREGEYFEEGHFSASQVKKELQDASVEAKVRALKRLLAAHASGVDVSGLLPEVVKAIAVPSLELKRLVYLFLILHAETSRGVALLSINSFQKDLADRNQIIRATALKALASIRLLEVVQLLMAALRRAAADSSPFVRRTAAQCVMKIFTLDSDQFQELQKIVLALLKDVEISVVGAALVAFRELCLRHGAADCLRYHESQLPPEQQHHEGYLQLCLEEQQQEGSTFLEGQRCLSRPPGSACSENGGRDASGDAATQRTDAGRGENGGDEEQENAEARWRTDAKLQGRWNGQKDGGRATDGGDGVRAATATDAAAATAASSKMLRRHRETGHMKSYATAATKWRNFKAQACALALLHQHYRRLQESMLQLEPFAQVVAVDLFLRYARLFFAEPAAAFRRKQQQQEKTQEAERQESEREKRYGGQSKGRLTGVTPSGNSTARGARSGVQFAAGDTLTFEKMVEESSANPLSADLRLFLWNLGQLLYSESVAVVAAVAAAFYHLLPAAAWKPLVHPLLRCIYTSSVEFQEPLLHIAAALAAAAPSLFLPHFRTFFLAYNDPPCVKQGKLLVLRRLLFSPHFASAAAAAEESATLPPLLLQELCTYIRWPGDPLLLSTCFNFLVNIALRFPSGQSACMQIFVQLLDTPPSCSLASEAILGLQVLLQQQQERPQHQQQRLQQERGCVTAGGAMELSGTAEWTEEKASFRAAELKKKQSGGRQQLGWLVLQLAIHLSRVVQGAAARASIVWIVGEYQREVGWVAADIFRQLASSFKEEPGEVKLQILLLGLKVWALHWDNKQRLKERAQQQGRFSATGAEREPKNVTAAAGTAAAAAAAGGGSESVATYEGGCSALMHNGVLPTAAPASQVGGQQQQHQERAWLHAGAAEEAQQKAGNRACEARQQEKQPQEREEEQFHLLPPPTPEESAAAFPRIDRMLKYVCEAASFDASYDVRDVARLYFALSRLALASERETFHGSRGSSDNRESSPTSSYNRSSSACNSGNGSRCNTSHSPLNTPTKNSNNDKGSKPHYFGDNRSIGEGRSEATAAGENEGNVPHVLEGLAGCGGQMFKNASPKALMDMSNFAQKYMRTLAKGPARGGQRSKPRPQHSLNIRHPGGALAGTAAGAAAPSSESEKKSESLFDFPSEGGNYGDRNSTTLTSRSPSTSNSGSSGSGRSSSSSAPTADDCPSSCVWEEQEARENFAGQSSALLLGSLSELLGERMRGYIDLPPFAVADSSDELRRVEQTAAPPELAQCLMRGRAAAAAGGERNSTLSTNFYMDVQDVKAISSEDIVVKRSAAALMGRDGNAKAEFTPLDLDSFYAEDLQSNGVAGVVPSVLQNVRDAPAAASFATALTPTSATSVQGNANSYPPAPASNTLFASASVITSETFPRGQQEEHLQQQQQQSLWDMFGEAHVPELHNGERVVQQRQQNSEGQSMAQYDDKVASDFLSVDGALEAGCVSVMADQVRGRGGGVAIAGEDEESD